MVLLCLIISLKLYALTIFFKQFSDLERLRILKSELGSCFSARPVPPLILACDTELDSLMLIFSIDIVCGPSN